MLIAFHKPYGVLCQFTPDQPGQRTLAEFNFPKGVYPLGRLDMDSEGLLLLSDEPALNNKLLDPEHAHVRIYWVQVEGIPDEADLQRLSNGSIKVKNHLCLPCIAKILSPQPQIPERIPPIRVRKNIPDVWIQIELIEGKNRQVRRMTAAVGHPTLRLMRTKIGNFQDHNLLSGTWRILTKADRDRILS
ncbi:pseudouridine synthase [Luteolibacter algae]|uniref:Pseudouridine synthase n=1 Tax=Luteolibacter algae TaxID=454151 RepID=A0ABW5D3N3_9BACT